MPWKTKVRVGVAIASIFALAAGVSACSPAAETPGGEGGGDKTVTVWMKKQLVEDQNTSFTERAKAYGAEKGVTVNVEIIAYEDFYAKWAAAIESGNVPDVSFFGYQEIGQFYEQGVLSDVTAIVDTVEKANGAISANLKQPVTFDGKLYGVPAWAEAQVMIYRTDLFQKAGISAPPATWEQFRADAAKLTDKAAGVYGAGIGYGQKNSDAEFWTRAVTWSYGGTLDASPEDAGGSEGKNAEAATLIQSIVKDGSTPQDALNWDDAGNNRSYLSGQSAIVFNAGSLLRTLATEAPDVYKNTAVAAFPAGPAGAVSPGIMNTFGVFKDAKNPEGAADSIASLLDKTWYQEWTDLGAPLAIPVYDELRAGGVWTEDPNKAFAASVDGATYLGSPSQYSPAAGTVYNNRLVNKTFQDILINGTDITAALAELRKQVDAAYAA